MSVVQTIWNFIIKQTGWWFVVDQEAGFNFTFVVKPPVGDWILEDGTWNDDGIWIDSAIWKDS